MQALESSKSQNTPKEQGFLAIIVAALIMIILSLITIGFTRIMQREQRQSLDRQLSRQAIYAAESGINDVYTALQSNPSLPTQKTVCDVTTDIIAGQPNPAVNDGIIDAGGNVAYTCALYDKKPKVLNYSVATNESKIVELKTDSGVPFSSLVFKWGVEQGQNNVTTLPACGTLPYPLPSSRSGNAPLIRLDLSKTALLTRDGLINSTDYLYLAPCTGVAVPTTYTYLSGEQGNVVEVVCSGSEATPCQITINISIADAVPSYVARFRAVYTSAQLSISGTDNTGNPVEFKQAQTSIDVTARASDVVRRLRVSIPLTSADNPPEGVFQVFDGVCKLLSVNTASVPVNVDDGCTY